MAFNSYLIKGRRSLRNTGRYRYRQNQENDEDSVHIDFTKDVNLITYEILKNVCQKQDISEEKYLAYLNAFVKLLIQYDKDYFSKISYCVEDIFICVRITLLNDSSLVRAAGLRALRYMIKSEQHVAIMNKLQYPALIARSLDLILVRNDSERVQALRLTRYILIVAPQLFHTAIARSLMCVALSSKTPAELEEDKQRRDRKEDDEEEKVNDRMARAFIAVITELCILNQDIFLDCGGVRALMHSLQVVRPGRMTESILGALLHLLNLPSTRVRACVDLQFIAASFTDLPCVETKTAWAYCSEIRAWYHVALLSLMRSWPGVLHFCHPHDPLSLKSLVATLYLNNLNVRKAVLEVLHELLGLPTPEWTDEFSVILEAVDPARFQDEFKLSEGFVAKEGKTILPHISKCRVNISELHMSLVLYCLLEADILNALIYVIISEDTLISVSATILLGELMYLLHKQLPPECINFSPAVPNLVSYAVRGRPALVLSRPPQSPPSPTTPGSLISATDLSRPPNFDQSTLSNNSKNQVVQSVMEMLADYNGVENTRQDIDQILNSHHVEDEFCVRSQQRALTAVTALSELHKMFRKRPAPASIFLDLVISHVEPRAPSQDADAIVKMKGKSLPKHKVPHILAKESEEAIKDSGVLTVKDAFAWNWEAIRAVFKTRAQPIVRLEESSHKMFLKKIVYFLLPSNNQLSRCDLYSSNNNNVYSLAAIDLLKFLLDCEHAEATRLLQEFLADLHDQLDCILTSESAHDTLLSPKNVSNTLCQHYFLFVGVLSNRNRGLQFLESSGVLEVLNRVALTSKHDCYVKLIVSSLDYSTSSATRLILSNILTCDQVSSRLYATQFLSILLRTKLELQPDYLNWVVESIVNQLQDEKKLVSLCALSALDEACDDKHYLEAVIALRPSLLYFGDKGLLLLIRFLSTTSGFTYLNEANFVSNQLERWATHFNYRYVQLMEADIHDSLTLHRRTEDGQYARRLSSARPPVGTAYVLPHLYGMLARHEAGFGVLRSHEHLYALFQRIIDGRCSTDEQILDLKAALWAAGNLATSPAGVRLLSEQGVLLPIVRLAEQCAVYSVRATGFYVLSMIATTRQGVALLHSMGWVSVRQNRHDLWPLVTCPLSSPPTTPEYMMEISASQQAAMGGHTSEESSESSDHVTPLFYMEDSGPGRSSLDTPLPWFRGKERASSERRSATLPHKSAMAPVPQHVRSYSESKAEMGSGVGDSWENTTDGQSHVTDELSDMRMSDVCKKSRSDSCCTDSSTSGVSSCDSSHAPRYHAIGEKVHQTLSPIPSTGSIATMKSVHPKPPDTSGGTTSKHRNSFSLRSKLMTQHSIGHSTFLSLRSLRPHPSPSVSIDLINFAEGNKMSPLVRPKLSAKYMHQPVSSEFEVTELPGLLLSDEEPTPTTPTVLAGAYPSSRSCIVGPAGQPTFGESETEDLWSGPCYQGICLPLHLPQMFPSLETIYSQENTHRLERGLDTEITSDQEAVDSDNEVEESKKPKFKHDRSCCLLCVVKYAPNRSQILRNRKISSSSIHRTRTETESSYGGGVGGEGESPILVPWPQQKTPALCETTPASGESSASHDNAFGFAKALMDSSSQSRSSVRKELLRLVELMANPILFRTCKQGLLTIKQSCKDLFQDVCVYSDVCNILAWCNHRLQARRFLQDLFVDSTFNELQEEPKSILTISPSCSLETDDLAHVATTSDRRDTASCDTDLDKAASTACELEVILESEGGGEASHRIDGEGQSRPADIVRPAKCDLNGCEGDGTLNSRGEKDSRVVDEGNGTPHSRLVQDSKAVDLHARLAQDSRVVQIPQSRLDNSRVFQTPRLANSGVGATSLADNCRSETYTRLGEDSNSRCDTSYSRLNQDAQNIEPSCTPQTEHVGDLPCKDQCPGGVPYKDPCPGSVPYKDHCPGGAYEDPCDEIWCPETKSDLILEKFESVYRSDSIDELSDEVLFLKPCSSRLVLSSPGEQSSADYRGTQPLSQRSLPLDQSGNVQPKSVSTSQLPSVPLDACLQTSLPTDPGCESVCQSGFSGTPTPQTGFSSTPTPQTGFSGNVPTTPQNHPTSLGLLDQTIASSRHCRARQYAEPLPSVSNESSALISSDKNERYGVPVSNNSSVKETSNDGDGSSSFLVHRPDADMDSGGSMNISTSQALNENISTSRELHENISISQAMGIETSSSLHRSNTDLSGARLSEPTSISRAMGINTPILHSSNTDPSGDRINKSSLISQSRDQSSAYSHQLTPTTSQLTDASNQSLPTGLNPGDSSLPSPSPERDVPNSPPPCIEPPSVSCSQSRISTVSSQPLNSSSSVNNPSSLSSQNSTNNQSSLHSPHSQNNPKSSQSSLNNPSFVNSPKSLHRPNSPISSSSQNSSDSKVSLGPLCSDSTANPQVENDLSRVPQVKSVTSKVQLATKSQVENTKDVQPVSPPVVQLANLSVVQLVNSSVVQLANPSEVESANASVVEPASPCHAETESSNQHALSSSESSDENFDRHTGREKTSVPRRISVEAVIEQIPRDVERGDVPGTDRLKGLVGSSHPGIDLCKGLSESSVDNDKQEGQDQLEESSHDKGQQQKRQDQLEESSVDKDQHKRSKEIDGQTDEIGKTSEKVPQLDESKEVYDPMSQSNELDQKTETHTSTCVVSNPGQNLDPKPDAKVSASDYTSDGSPKKESKTNEAKKSKSKNPNSKTSEPASKGNSGKNNSKLPLIKNKETSPSESNRSKVAGGESRSKPSKQGEVSQKQASKDQTQASLGDSTGKNAETKKNLNETNVKSEETKRNSKISTSIRTSSDVSTGSKSSGSTSEENLNKSTTVSDRKGTIKTPPANTNEPVAKDKPSSKKTTEPSADKLTSPSGKKATEPSADKVTSPSGKKVTEPSAKSVTTGPVKKSVPKTSTSPNEEAASKPLALSARKSLPLTTSTEFASCKSVALSARKSLPLTSSSDAGAKPTQGDLGKPITLIKTNGLGEDCRMKPTSSIPVVSQHRKMSVYKPPIPGMSD